jgi:hypothetical protein
MSFHIYLLLAVCDISVITNIKQFKLSYFGKF